MKTVCFFLALILAAPGLVLAADERDSQTAPSSKTDSQITVIEMPAGASPATEITIRQEDGSVSNCFWWCAANSPLTCPVYPGRCCMWVCETITSGPTTCEDAPATCAAPPPIVFDLTK